MVPRVAQVLGGQLPAVSPKYPNVSHQEQNRPLTHLYLLISHIRKTPPCPTAISRPHSGIPDMSHQEQNRSLTHFFLLILHIRKPLTCPTAISRPHPRIPDVSHQAQNRPLTHFSLLTLHIRKPLTCPRCKKQGKNCFWGGKTESKAKNEAKIAR